MGSTGPAGYVQGQTPDQTYAQFQALPPDQQQVYVDQYQGLNPWGQQDWLNATGQTDPTGGMNNPAWTAPVPSPVPRAPQAQNPLMTQGGPGGQLDPATGDPYTGNPWDDLTSPRFREWFDQELTEGRSPGLNYTGVDPGGMYGTYNARAEQQALTAQYTALPPEVRDAYVARYMTLSPAEQTVWRQAFGADPAPTATDPGQPYGPGGPYEGYAPPSSTSGPYINPVYIGGQPSWMMNEEWDIYKNQPNVTWAQWNQLINPHNIPGMNELGT